jgi:hypothetical protein
MTQQHAAYEKLLDDSITNNALYREHPNFLDISIDRAQLEVAHRDTFSFIAFADASISQKWKA